MVLLNISTTCAVTAFSSENSGCTRRKKKHREKDPCFSGRTIVHLVNTYASGPFFFFVLSRTSGEILWRITEKGKGKWKKIKKGKETRKTNEVFAEARFFSSRTERWTEKTKHLARFGGRSTANAHCRCSATPLIIVPVGVRASMSDFVLIYNSAYIGLDIECTHRIV